MKFYNFLNEDKVKDALGLPEPKIGEEYPPEKIQRYIELIDKALKEMEKKEENDSNDSIVQDLRDKKKKWQNVNKETKPIKTKKEEPPPEQDQQQELPPEQQQENKLRKYFKTINEMTYRKEYNCS